MNIKSLKENVMVGLALAILMVAMYIMAVIFLPIAVVSAFVVRHRSYDWSGQCDK